MNTERLKSGLYGLLEDFGFIVAQYTTYALSWLLGASGGLMERLSKALLDKSRNFKEIRQNKGDGEAEIHAESATRIPIGSSNEASESAGAFSNEVESEEPEEDLAEEPTDEDVSEEEPITQLKAV